MLMKCATKIVLTFVLVFFCSRGSYADDQLQGEHVTVGGFVSSPGIIPLDLKSSVVSFLIRNKLIRADSKMQEIYNRRESVEQYRIKIVRDNELLEIEFKGGDSFANTIPIRSGDVIEVVLTDQSTESEWRKLDKFLVDDD